MFCHAKNDPLIGRKTVHLCHRENHVYDAEIVVGESLSYISLIKRKLHISAVYFLHNRLSMPKGWRVLRWGYEYGETNDWSSWIKWTRPDSAITRYTSINSIRKAWVYQQKERKYPPVSFPLTVFVTVLKSERHEKQGKWYEWYKWLLFYVATTFSVNRSKLLRHRVQVAW